jgi:hypothetical protein
VKSAKRKKTTTAAKGKGRSGRQGRLAGLLEIPMDVFYLVPITYSLHVPTSNKREVDSMSLSARVPRQPRAYEQTISLRSYVPSVEVCMEGGTPERSRNSGS